MATILSVLLLYTISLINSYHCDNVSKFPMSIANPPSPLIEITWR